MGANEISSDQGWDETKVTWEVWDPELENEIRFRGRRWEDWDPELANEISTDQGWDETQVKRSETWPVPPWEDDRYKDCFTDGQLDPEKCPYLMKRSKTWPVPPEDDPKYKDCFTDGLLDPTKCPYKRSSGQGWDETKTYWEDWDPELANEIRGPLDQHKPNPLDPQVEPNLQFPDGPAKRFLNFPPGNHGNGDWNGPQVEPPTDPSLERFSKFPGKFPPGHHGEGDWNGPQVEPPTDPALDLFVRP